jgi:iron complex outermembrane receptor protein
MSFLGDSILATAALANEESRVQVNLSPGSLQQALNDLARVAQLQLLYDPALVRGCSTAGVKGIMTPAQALEKLLASTEVAFKFTADDAVALYRKHHSSPDPPQQFATERLAGSVQPQLITVTADRSMQVSHEVNSSLTAMKVDGPALVTPVAFQSLSQQVLRDRQAARLEDILEDISSVESAPDGLSTLGFSIRGFPTYQYYIDGVRVSPDLHNDGFRDLANVDHIDVVKGPASTLYGRTEPGGLINVVTKQPLPNAHLSLEQQAGAFRRRRTQLDAGGPLTSAGSVRYRFNMAYESGGSFREFLSNRRFFVSPVVSWIASPETQTTAYLEYLRSDDPTDAGLPVIGSSLPPVPVGRRVEDGGEIHTTDLRVGLRGLHSVSDRWSVRYHLDSRWLRTPQSPQLALADNGLDPGSCTPDQCLLDHQLFALPVSRGHTYFASMDLLGSTTLWGTHHSLLFGAEYFDVHGHNEMLIGGSMHTVDLFNSPHQAVSRTFLQNPDSAFAATSVEQWTGVYFQDHIALTEKLYLLAGGRFDYVRESLDTAFGFPLVDSGGDSRRDSAFKRRAGVLWNPIAPLSAYANYTENFGIATGLYGNGTGGTGTLLPAQSAHEWEVGVKAEIFDGKVAGSAAWYDLTEVNIAQSASSPLLSAQGFRTVTGTARSRGLELDVHGEILPNLQLMASYAYVDSRIVDDAGARASSDGDPGPRPGTTGNRLYGVAQHGGSLWLAYGLSRGSLGGLKLGIGVVARAERAGDNANDYKLPAFAKWRMLAAYGWRAAGTRFNLQLNVDNVFNARYFESISGNYSVMPGYPRRWLVSVRAEL